MSSVDAVSSCWSTSCLAIAVPLCCSPTSISCDSSSSLLSSVRWTISFSIIWPGLLTIYCKHSALCHVSIAGGLKRGGIVAGWLTVFWRWAIAQAIWSEIGSFASRSVLRQSASGVQREETVFVARWSWLKISASTHPQNSRGWGLGVGHWGWAYFWSLSTVRIFDAGLSFGRLAAISMNSGWSRRARLPCWWFRGWFGSVPAWTSAACRLRRRCWTFCGRRCSLAVLISEWSLPFWVCFRYIFWG